MRIKLAFKSLFKRMYYVDYVLATLVIKYVYFNCIDINIDYDYYSILFPQ